MTARTAWTLAVAVLLPAATPAAEPKPPQHVLEGDGLKLTLYLPDAKAGYYRGTRFDWSGIVATAETGGHTVFGYWKDTHNPANHDDVPGTAEEFSHDEPLGYAEAPVGGTFVKIGVGVLEKPAESKYRFFNNYKIAQPGAWDVKTGDKWVEFRQELAHPSGYGYRYAKAVRLLGPGAFAIERTLTNTGTKRLTTDHYGHHFLTVDGDPIGPNYALRFPFPARAKSPEGLRDVAAVRDSRLVFLKPLVRGDVQSQIVGWGDRAEDNRVTVEHAKSGLALRVVNDRPLAKFNVWSVRTTLCPEPFVALDLEPGRSLRWATRYEFELPQK
jgi:hypothetical protein